MRKVSVLDNGESCDICMTQWTKAPFLDQSQLVTLKPFVDLGIHQQLCSSVLQIDLTGFFFQKVGSLGDWLFLDDWVQQCSTCIFLLWECVVVLTVYQARLSREARMFSHRTWRQSLWLSFYSSTSCSKKEGLISFLQCCLCLSRSWRWQWLLHSCILHILLCALMHLMPCWHLPGGFIVVFLHPKTLFRSGDVNQNQPETSLKRFCVRIVLHCSKLIWSPQIQSCW